MSKRGIVFGTWDLLHPGHLYLLDYASHHCDELLVGLHVDPSIERNTKNKPVESVFERYERLTAVKGINRIIPYDTEHDIENIISIYQPDIQFLGEEYEYNEAITGFDIGRKFNPPLKYDFLDRYHDWSSSSLRQKVVDDQYLIKYQEPFLISPGVGVTEVDG